MSASSSRLTVGTWNIGGGILGDSHQLHGTAQLNYHISKIREWAPDILCLQEAHEFLDGDTGQAEILASAAGYKHIHTVPISPSHLDSAAQLSLSVMSSFEISNPRYTKFPNPGLSSHGPNGEHWVLFDKGYMTVTVKTDAADFTLVNAHCFPLHYFGVTATDPQFTTMWSDFARELIGISEGGAAIAAIDLNYDPIEDLISEIFSPDRYSNAFTRTPTIPKGSQQDYIVYTGSALRLEETAVIPTAADHHYCQARFVL
jgi:hypothetical protein